MNKNFNSHAHVERDKSQERLDTETGHFNSHAHVERDYDVMERFAKIYDFNSHAHVERDHQAQSQLQHGLLFQLTRSRGA